MCLREKEWKKRKEKQQLQNDTVGKNMNGQLTQCILANVKHFHHCWSEKGILGNIWLWPLTLTKAMRSLNSSQRPQMNSAKEMLGISTSGTGLRRSAGEATGPELRHLANSLAEKSLGQLWLCCDDGWQDFLIDALLSDLDAEVRSLQSRRMLHMLCFVRARVIMVMRNTAKETQQWHTWIFILKDADIRLVVLMHHTVRAHHIIATNKKSIYIQTTHIKVQNWKNLSIISQYTSASHKAYCAWSFPCTCSNHTTFILDKDLKNHILQFLFLTHLWLWNLETRSRSSNLVWIGRPQAMLLSRKIWKTSLKQCLRKSCS